jgi:hypothetical protein
VGSARAEKAASRFCGIRYIRVLLYTELVAVKRRFWAGPNSRSHSPERRRE